MQPLSIPERLAARSVQDGACVVWTGGKQPDGYGKIFVYEGGRCRTKLVHRVAYETYVGPIPPAHDIDHICWRRDCICPSHLRPLPLRENRKLRRNNRKSDGSCFHGHALSGANLYVTPAGHMRCRTCRGLATTRYRARLKARK